MRREIVADPLPAQFRKTNRRLRPMPDGPFPVPVSTLDWLLSRESLAARTVTLRSLMVRPNRDPELKKALREFSRDPFVHELLPLLARRLAPGGTAHDIEHRYDGSLWQTLFLTEIGGGEALAEVRRAGPVLLAHWEKSFIEIDRKESLSADLAPFSIACRTLARIGFASDGRVRAAVEYLARRRLAAGAHPLPASKDLLLFASLPMEARSETVREAIAFCVERVVGEELRSLSPARDTAIVFPAFDLPDPLEALEALVAVGVPKRPGISVALAAVASRADHRARWKLDRLPPGPMLLEPEVPGELSRWVTLRALVVFQHFQGLTTTLSPRGG